MNSKKRSGPITDPWILGGHLRDNTIILLCRCQFAIWCNSTFDISFSLPSLLTLRFVKILWAAESNYRRNWREADKNSKLTVLMASGVNMNLCSAIPLNLRRTFSTGNMALFRRICCVSANNSMVRRFLKPPSSRFNNLKIFFASGCFAVALSTRIEDKSSSFGGGKFCVQIT